MAYDLYPAVDENYAFPVEVRQSLAVSMELRNTVIPMTTALRNNLMPAELWDGRTIANTTTDHLERYDVGTGLWVPISEAADMAAAKAYVDTTRVGRNRIINGDFRINQRGFTTASSVGVSVYGLDRWSSTASGGTCVYAGITATPGELPESAYSYARMTTTGQSAAGNYALLLQTMDDVRTLSGKTATLSFWAKASTAGLKVSAELQQGFGVGGSTSVSIPVGIVTLTTGWVRYSLTIAVPSLVGKTVGSNNTLTLNFWTSSGSTYAARSSNLGNQNGSIDLWGVQFEEGSIATAFEHVAYRDNLTTCMRYFQRHNFVVNVYMIPATAYHPAAPAIGRYQFPVVMRVAPIMSFPANGAARYICNIAGGGGAQTITSNGSDPEGVSLQSSSSYAASSGWMDNFIMDANAEY